jgi:ParB family chromosome partitioning protein
MNKEIVMIERERLLPHPKNPRRDLGDLTELAESLKSQGVLQNLTLVPCPEDADKYYVLIGNRRRAAGEIAGLKEFPCRIEENMSEADQIAVMMSENMQRSDLTIADQDTGCR